MDKRMNDQTTGSTHRTLVRALDYIYLMALDDENMAYGKTSNQEHDKVTKSKSNDSSAKTKSPSGPSSGGYQTLLDYISQLYPDVLRGLLTFYKLQARKDYFCDLGRRCEETESWPPGFGNEKEGLMKQIRFASLHNQASIIAPIDLRLIEGKDWKKRDIFGWTALQYAASCTEFIVLEECQHPILRSNQLPGCLKALLRQSHPQT
ncbi:serine threonine phosphatase 6 regulatory ankyrin repeat subunit A [Fusarium napiforme]|uniref:Serine threonine phosphatase 6 regulatory ankyrin repeat subunit A n=1 Tax=Fusarium napiforme TaxID=42672 RepID=A0A8H5J8R8_9HYPO|nr:serine threonine phosphatase 6 regulatory ankyrin repeat subunit A [Fusarium napiforme]